MLAFQPCFKSHTESCLSSNGTYVYFIMLMSLGAMSYLQMNGHYAIDEYSYLPA